jgi:class 3 adenylate cyclase/predicted ATPase
MDFETILDQAIAMLQRRGRLTYGALKRQFQLDDAYLADLKDELIDGQQVAVDENGKVLVWTGGETSEETPAQLVDAPSVELPASVPSPQPEREAPTGERRQLTVMFCDLVGSTALSEQLDPEELQAVVRTYQEVSAQVIERYEGYIAQYLGDGLLVYFGYPAAHEDDAARAIRAGLEIVTALDEARSQFAQPVQVRIGIHTGPVVVGEMGGGSRHEQLALGETPNIAARVQGQAEPNEVVISTATRRLVTGLFEIEDRGLSELKGISTLQALSRVVGESEAQSRFEVAVRTGLTPFIGREEELGLLRRRWERTEAGEGQVVLLSGEPGIGKSRLLQELKNLTGAAAPVSVECRCSPYLQNSALSPVIGHLERLLRFARSDLSETKLQKLEQTLTTYDFTLADTVPLLTSLLSLPLPDTYAPPQVSPQKQKKQTLELLVTWLRKDAERQPVRVDFEDLHWADPSTVEFLTLLVEQIPTMRALLVLTFRPEFTPPWPSRAYMLPLYLDRLPQSQVTAMVEQVAGKALPAEVVEQVMMKTDGVPLFVEELTKTVVESGQLQETEERFELTSSPQQMTIPTTLQDSLRARLDRLNMAQDVAQIGATIGREFSYALLQAVSSLEEAELQQGLRQLVEADLVFQKGLPPQAQYVFKHALIRDTAYESLLKRRRQELHAQTAQVLEQQFTETVATQPELLAHHYTEASLAELALPHWLQAGQLATQRFAMTEAIQHLTTGVVLLQTQPDSPERAQRELHFYMALSAPLVAAAGYGAPELKQTFERAYALCQQLGETPELFGTLVGLWLFHNSGPSVLQMAREVADQLLRLAQLQEDAGRLQGTHGMMSNTLWFMGELAATRVHLEQALALDASVADGFVEELGVEAGMCALAYTASNLWLLGFPEQALRQSTAAGARAQELAHPFNSVVGLELATVSNILRREPQITQERANALISLSTEQGLPLHTAWGHIYQGWVLGEQGHTEQGRDLLKNGLSVFRASGLVAWVPFYLGLVAQLYGQAGQAEEGLSVLAEAREIVTQRGERWSEAEVYRLTGELTLQAHAQDLTRTKVEEAEAWFHKAIAIARQQEAKSWELRSAMSLARLWQQQGATHIRRDKILLDRREAGLQGVSYCPYENKNDTRDRHADYGVDSRAWQANVQAIR